MENLYKLKKGLTMSEINDMEILLNNAIRNQFKLIELCDTESYKSICYKEISNYYAILDKIKIENIERVTEIVKNE